MIKQPVMVVVVCDEWGRYSAYGCGTVLGEPIRSMDIARMADVADDDLISIGRTTTTVFNLEVQRFEME